MRMFYEIIQFSYPYLRKKRLQNHHARILCKTNLLANELICAYQKLHEHPYFDPSCKTTQPHKFLAWNHNINSFFILHIYTLEFPNLPNNITTFIFFEPKLPRLFFQTFNWVVTSWFSNLAQTSNIKSFNKYSYELYKMLPTKVFYLRWNSKLKVDSQEGRLLHLSSQESGLWNWWQHGTSWNLIYWS